jgi:phosphatidylglycerophosphate synthase
VAGLKGARWWTLANALTSLRLLSAVPLYCLIVSESWVIACVVFWLAVASDLVDGRIARARGETSAFGGLLDHGSDAIFVVSGLVALAIAGQAPWLLPLFVAAAFTQYVLDSKTLAGRPLRASLLGRWNGILYFIPLGIVVTRESVGLAAPPDALILWLGWGLVASTLVSMSDRAWALLGPAPSA